MSEYTEKEQHELGWLMDKETDLINEMEEIALSEGTDFEKEWYDTRGHYASIELTEVQTNINNLL